MDRNDQNSDNQPSWSPFLILAVLIIVTWLLWPAALSKVWKISEDSSRGLFGDSFGALNTLFSGLAFAALGYTMWMQRKELAETRSILKSQKDEAEAQNRTLALQAFENTFFQLLKLHTDAVGAMDLKPKKQFYRATPGQGTELRDIPSIATGRACFEIFVRELREDWSNLRGHPEYSELERIQIAFNTFFSQH